MAGTALAGESHRPIPIARFPAQAAWLARGGGRVQELGFQPLPLKREQLLGSLRLNLAPEKPQVPPRKGEHDQHDHRNQPEPNHYSKSEIQNSKSDKEVGEI